MLKQEVRQQIQQAYTQLLAAKNLKPRYGQKLMIAEIARTLGNISLDEEVRQSDQANVCVIEAGTGVGKTVAYLLATLPVAMALDKRVIIATATVALQEQVVFKDVPDVLLNSGLKFNFALAKGRGRYLCLAKLDRILSSDDQTQLIPLYEDADGVLNEKDVNLYKTMLDGLSRGTWDGDKDNWGEEIQTESWQRVTTDHRQCTGRKCSHVRSCSFFKARDALAEADCIVANHDLVLADLALGGGAILPPPEQSIYIFDEGHHLPEKALNHFSNHSRFKSTLRWLGQSEGQWPKLIEPLASAIYFNSIAVNLEPELQALRKIHEESLPVLQDICLGIARDQRSQQLRFENGVAPESLEKMALRLSNGFASLCQILKKIYDELNVLIDQDHNIVPMVDLENLFPVVGAWLARAEGNLALWQQYVDTRHDESWPIARWITQVEFNELVDYDIVVSPVLASRTLANGLWSRCFGAVVTSATLTALNSFERFKYRAGTFDNCTYATVPSPFNFQENALLKIPKEAVEANNAMLHTQSVITLLPKIIDVKKGSLVLFSSRRQMLDVFDELPIQFKGLILIQGVESKQSLIKSHKSRIDDGDGSIIFGLASFAEGVDLPGNYCTHVVIAKIPFSVPDDPLEAALCEWIEARGGNSFMEVSVPDASIRLIQSCGRLLRTESDSGEITILDKRLLTKRYGRALLDSLPPYKRVF